MENQEDTQKDHTNHTTVKHDRRRVAYSNVKEHWHLSKAVNISVIVAIFILALTGISHVDGIKTEVREAKAEIRHVKEKQEILNNKLGEDIKELKNTSTRQYQTLDRKLDKLIDRQLDGRK